MKWSIPRKAAMWDTFENSTSNCKNALKLQRECRFCDAKHAVTSGAVVQNWSEIAARVEFPCRQASIPLQARKSGILMKAQASIPQNAGMWDTFEGLKKTPNRVQFE